MSHHLGRDTRDSPGSDQPTPLPDVPQKRSTTKLDASRPRRPTIQAYLTVLGTFLGLFSTFGLITSFGTFQTRYQFHELSHISPSQISWIGSLQLFLFFLAGWPIGYLFDRHGPKWLLFAGSFLLVLSLLLTSFATKYFHYILAQGILFGFSCSLVFFPSMASVSTHFVQERYGATASGIAISGTSLGGVLWPVILDVLVVRMGWKDAVRVVLGIAGGCCFAAVVLVSRPPRIRPPTNSSSEKDASPSDSKPCIITHFKSISRSMRSALTDLAFLTFTIGTCLVGLGLYTPYFYLPSHAKQLFPHSSAAATTTLPSTTLTVLNAGSFFGRILPLILADHLGEFNLLIPSSFLCSLFMFVFWPFTLQGMGSKAILLGFSGSYGFVSGSFVGLMYPCIAKMTNKEEVIGEKIGLVFTFNSIAVLIGEPIAGAILVLGKEGVKEGYLGLMMYAASVVLSGTVVLVVTRWNVVRRGQRTGRWLLVRV